MTSSESDSRPPKYMTNPGLLLGGVPNYNNNPSAMTETSIFDPTLCELLYRWFSPPTGVVVDPFAGGSVRGIVAAKLGRRYFGVDLSARQIAANRKQGKDICGENQPSWFVGDSRNIKAILGNITADFILSCPPYGDLEVYSDDPADLSNMDYGEFIKAYREIIRETVSMLAPNRFAAFVVGDFRDASGYYRCFPEHTVQAFVDAGMGLYNNAVLVTAVGTLAIRARRAFTKSRKLGKTHQNVLIFCNGDPTVATEACGPCDFGDFDVGTEAKGDQDDSPENADDDSAFGERF